MDAASIRKVAGFGLTMAAASMPLLVVAVPLAITPLFVATAIAGVAAVASSGRGAQRRGETAFLVLFAGIVGWAFLSASWAAQPTAALRLAFSVALTLAGGWSLLTVASTLSSSERRRLETALVAGVVVALVVLVGEAAGRQFLRWSLQQWILEGLGRRFDAVALNRGLAVMAILVWPAALVLWRRAGVVPALLPSVALASILSAFESATAGLAFVAAIALPALAAACGRHAFRLVGIGLAIAIVAAPLLPRIEAVHARLSDRKLVNSVWHRAEIWHFTAERIAERPLLGWGMNASRSIPGGKDRIEGDVERLPLHPHNAVLQIWLELGAVGASLALALMLAVLHRITRKAATADRMAGMAAFGAALAVASTGYGLWQAWWLSSLLLLAAIVAALCDAAEEDVPARE